ncbi:hypothetical protein [Adlercreutzia sp. ZJ473]|uniref:hypothetical protein n=1 Tax=Adlercreutzia sp. ZJ473 TaxID=2722822 RepID=UPI00155595E7|nr:hypothetical protein [Adlercreutzia sp. ZJ473]
MSGKTTHAERGATPCELARTRAAVVVAVIACCVAVAAALGAAAGAGASEPAYRLAKATLSDCTASAEADSAIESTSGALLEGLSFVEGNPFFLNVREALVSDCRFPLPTEKFVEKCEWKYDDAGNVKTATFYKSTNELSRVQLSYDAHGSASKVIGWTYADEGDGRGVVRHDFETSIVNEKLSGSAYGANKFTVVHDDTTSNDTVLFTYDKDKNLNTVASKGKHEWAVDVSYVTAQKVPKTLKLSEDGKGAGAYLAPTYDGANKLVSLKRGTWEGDEVQLSGDEYVIQYSGGKYSKVRYYQDDVEVKYYDFKYDEHGNLTSIRVYKKGGVQLYNITFAYELA